VSIYLTGEMKDKIYKILFGKSQRKGVTWKDSIQMDFTKIKKGPLSNGVTYHSGVSPLRF